MFLDDLKGLDGIKEQKGLFAPKVLESLHKLDDLIEYDVDKVDGLNDSTENDSDSTKSTVTPIIGLGDVHTASFGDLKNLDETASIGNHPRMIEIGPRHLQSRTRTAPRGRAPYGRYGPT